jgi:hypothetical protein
MSAPPRQSNGVSFADRGFADCGFRRNLTIAVHPLSPEKSVKFQAVASFIDQPALVSRPSFGGGGFFR